MNSETQSNNLKQTMFAFLFSFIMAIASTFIIYFIDTVLRLLYLVKELKISFKDVFLNIYLDINKQDNFSHQTYANIFSPLTEFQFYSILFVVVFGLIVGLLFYIEQKEIVIKEVSEFRSRMEKKKAKKSKKVKARKQ